MTVREQYARLRELARVDPIQGLEIGLASGLLDPRLQELLEIVGTGDEPNRLLQPLDLFPPVRGYTRLRRRWLRTTRIWFAAAMLEYRFPNQHRRSQYLRLGGRITPERESQSRAFFIHWPDRVSRRSPARAHRVNIYDSWLLLLHEQDGRDLWADKLNPYAQILTDEFRRCAAWQLTRDQPMDLGVRV